MLEHLGEAAMVVVGAWRFVLSRSYRRAKLAEWRAARETFGGKLVITGEILAATVVGIVLPLWLIAVVATNR